MNLGSSIAPTWKVQMPFCGGVDKVCYIHPMDYCSAVARDRLDAESVVVVARGWGEGMGSQCLMGTEFQFRKMRKFWRWWWCWWHSGGNALHATELYTLKNG